MKVAATLLVLGVLLGGCSDEAQPADDEPVPVTPPEEEDLPQLHGAVVDASIQPLAGVRLEILELNVTTMSEADGAYGFDDLPVERSLILVATLIGYEPLSKQVTLPVEGVVRLDFQMVPLPVEEPYMDQVPFNGLITCAGALGSGTQNAPIDCSLGENQDDFDFAIGPDIAGVVVEVGWEAVSPLSENMGARIISLGLGDQNQELVAEAGPSVLRLQVPADVLASHYPAGGHARLEVFAASPADEEGTGGAALAINQSFDVVVSLFYFEGPDPSFSAA